MARSMRVARHAVVLIPVFVALVLAAPCFAASPGLPEPVRKALAAAGIPAERAAVWVQAIGASQPSVDYNATAPMNPASVIKLVTTYSALELLGPTHVWKTEAWSAAPLAGDVLQGDLILRGGGDPKLTVESFWLLLRALRGRGIREIRGDLVLDRSWLDGSGHDASLFDGQPTQPYNVGPDALLLNFKAFRFWFVPDAERRTVTVVSEPPSSALEMRTELKLVDGPCPDWRAGLKADFQNGPASARAAFTGVYPLACGERVWNIALLPHPTFVQGVFKRLWEEQGGVAARGWREGTVPPGARLLYRHESPPLTEVVRDINKFSNNVMARQLFLGLSAEIGGPPGRSDRSAALIKGWAELKGLRMPELVLENGSGLSRDERISAGSLGRLLMRAYESAVMPEFMSSLPLVAFDGTMRRRFKVDSLAGQAHIKTGSLTGVRSVAGYVLDRNGRRHVMAFIVNHANAANAQPAQDALLRWIHESDR
jgi:D-alanyl-D-alanine carboxypeptidase/D-alanyl-D-alanine-endopeptidase (penicillin-binding protein 4)